MLQDIFIGEFLGTMFLILLGNGVVANVVLKKTAGTKSGFLAITLGWGVAVFIGIIIANSFGTGGHLNPAVTMMSWVKGDLNSAKAFTYFGAELSGALVGQIIISTFYLQQINDVENKDAVLSMHSTAPMKKHDAANLFSEFVGTGVLLSAALVLGLSFNEANNAAMGQIMNFAGPLTMGLVVFSIGISLGGTTGYAINPARDLMPRIVYTLAPYKNKVKSANWRYGWIPVIAPLVAGVVVGGFAHIM